MNHSPDEQPNHNNYSKGVEPGGLLFDSRWLYIYNRDLKELSERLQMLEHTLYTGNGRPSLVQQVAELTVRLAEVKSTLEQAAKTTEQNRSTRYQVFWETLSFAFITIISSVIATTFSLFEVKLLARPYLIEQSQVEQPTPSASPAPSNSSGANVKKN